MGILERVEQPADLLRLSVPELEQLAEEIRQVILNTVAVNQGHLSSNLGIVELTLAMHYVFESPRDRILWDVGHQCYAHKLVTGRREEFKTIRTLGGLAGFPRPSESRHDTFHTGHAGTAISTAVGMAAARDLQGEDYKIVAVVGDGALPNGMSMEAINHIGQLKSDLIIVLNDNEMAISRTVGAMSAYLNRIMSTSLYDRVRERVERFLSRFRRVGPPVRRLARHLEGDIKGFWGPGALFEELGLRYLGPFDGNDLKRMIQVFRRARTLRGPIIVHAVTKKGKGYPLAEQDPIKYYAPPPFDVATGKIHSPASKAPAYSDVFTQALIKIAEGDPRVVAVTAAMLEGTKLTKFHEVFPRRIWDVGIAEEHAIGFAAGLAAAGRRPFVAMYSTFLQRSYDQVMHDVCLQDLPVVIGIDRGGLVGEDGPTHHGVFDFAYLRHLPNMVVMAPSDENEMVKMMVTALKTGHPCSLRFPRGDVAGVAVETVPGPVPLGRGRMVREGDDVALISCGTQLATALEVATRLADEDGVGAAVADARFVKPIDEEMVVGLALRCGRIVTLEEHARMGGFGSAVLETLAARGVSVPVLVLGLPDSFVEHGSLKQLKDRYGLSPGPVLASVREFLRAGRSQEAGDRRKRD